MRPLLCWVGVHAWRTERTDDGDGFERCARCRRDRSGAVEAPLRDPYGRAGGFFGGSA